MEGYSQVFKVFFQDSSTAPQFFEERISERIVEQIVDIPGGGLQGFRPCRQIHFTRDFLDVNDFVGSRCRSVRILSICMSSMMSHF